MSITLMAAVFGKDIKPAGAKLVALALADYANHEGKCWPSWKALEKKTSLHRATIARALTRLKELGVIESKQQFEANIQTVSMITFPVSQFATAEGSQNETQNRHTVKPHRRNTTPQRRASKIAEDWTPDETLLAWCAEKHPTVDAVMEALKFRDHYISIGKPRKDWNASFRNWIRNEEKFQRQRGPAHRSKPAAIAANNDELVNRILGSGTTGWIDPDCDQAPVKTGTG